MLAWGFEGALATYHIGSSGRKESPSSAALPTSEICSGAFASCGDAPKFCAMDCRLAAMALTFSAAASFTPLTVAAA
jgi:hypothetical protein